MSYLTYSEADNVAEARNPDPQRWEPYVRQVDTREGMRYIPSWRLISNHEWRLDLDEKSIEGFWFLYNRYLSFRGATYNAALNDGLCYCGTSHTTLMSLRGEEPPEQTPTSIWDLLHR